MKNEEAIKHAQQLAQECAMKANRYRQSFIRAAWMNILGAIFLGSLGLPMLFIFLPIGMIVMACAVMCAYDAVKAFQYAEEAYKEYFEIRDSILDKKHQHEINNECN